MLFSLILATGKLMYSKSECAVIVSESGRNLDEKRKIGQGVNYCEPISGEGRKGLKYTALSIVEYTIAKDKQTVKCIC